MTNLCLENYGVSTLETREMRTTNGGSLVGIAIVICLVAAFAYGVYRGYQDRKAEVESQC